jgi:hypothetical protein
MERAMAYFDPIKVVSPKASWGLKAVIHNTGQGGWSAAEGEWDGTPCLAVRWNGSDTDEGVGNPQSRGYPTWFVVPDELRSAVRQEIDRLSETGIVQCDINRPEEYELGAWRVVITLGPQVLYRLDGGLLVFSLPTLPNRMCHADKGYFRAIEGELRGCFQDGKWYGDVYSNGISENEN